VHQRQQVQQIRLPPGTRLSPSKDDQSDTVCSLADVYWINFDTQQSMHYGSALVALGVEIEFRTTPSSLLPPFVDDLTEVDLSCAELK